MDMKVVSRNALIFIFTLLSGPVCYYGLRRRRNRAETCDKFLEHRGGLAITWQLREER
jgi:hypothetical protein